MKVPNVQQHMTRLPLEIEQIDKVGNAKRLMELFGIRHVPVMSGIRLRGVISQSDILNATIELGRNIDNLPIEEFCEHDVLQVGPLTPVDEVAQKCFSAASEAPWSSMENMSLAFSRRRTL